MMLLMEKNKLPNKSVGYTTVKQIRWGLFGFTNQVAASQKALDALEGMRSGIGAAEQCATGLCGTWEGLQIQLDML